MTSRKTAEQLPLALRARPRDGARGPSCVAVPVNAAAVALIDALAGLGRSAGRWSSAGPVGSGRAHLASAIWREKCGGFESSLSRRRRGRAIRWRSAERGQRSRIEDADRSRTCDDGTLLHHPQQ
jgi:hypothetical protein